MPSLVRKATPISHSVVDVGWKTPRSNCSGWRWLMFVAHGVGTRSDLPLPVSLAAIGAGLVVMISFGVLAVLWRGPRLSRDAGIPLPQVLMRVADGSVTRLLLQAVTLAVGLLVCVL